MFLILVFVVEECMGNYDIKVMCVIMYFFNQWMLEEWIFNCNNWIFIVFVISFVDVDWVVKELDWVIKNGVKIVLVCFVLVFGIMGICLFGFKEFDFFWVCINELKIFVFLYVFDSGYDCFVCMWVGGNEFQLFVFFVFSYILKFVVCVIVDICVVLICYGVFDCFFEVKVVIIENGVVWVGDLIKIMGKVYKVFLQEFKYDLV